MERWIEGKGGLILLITSLSLPFKKNVSKKVDRKLFSSFSKIYVYFFPSTFKLLCLVEWAKVWKIKFCQLQNFACLCCLEALKCFKIIEFGEISRTRRGKNMKKFCLRKSLFERIFSNLSFIPLRRFSHPRHNKVKMNWGNIIFFFTSNEEKLKTFRFVFLPFPRCINKKGRKKI